VQDAAQGLGLAPPADEGAMMPASDGHGDGLRTVDETESWDTRLTRREVADLLLWFPIAAVQSAAATLVAEYLAGPLPSPLLRTTKNRHTDLPHFVPG
jgi:hypothetical protein